MDQRTWIPDEPTFEAEVGGRIAIANEILKAYGSLSGQVDADIVLLQRAIDAPALSQHETVGWQSLGIAFGMILARELGLCWVMVDDEYGRDPALQYENTTTLIFPLTIISKRIERGEPPVLRELFDALERDLRSRFHQRPASS
jgi:uncharacterized protein DUF3806